MRYLGLAAITALVAACAAQAEPLDGETPRAAGPAIHWTLSNHDGAPKPLAFISQGSGCAPARANERLQALADRLDGFAVLTVEKYGVAPGDAPEHPMDDCAPAHVSNHTVLGRVSDVQQVLGDLQARGLYDGRLALFGGSEGGAVAAILAREVRETDAVAILSTGTGLTMAEFLPELLPPPARPPMLAMFDQVRAEPDADGVIGGVSLKWWAEMVDRRLSDDLLAAEAPVLIIHGELDQSAPVSAARATREAFAEAGRADRLSYREKAGLDHVMADAGGVSHLDAVLDETAAWLAAQTYDRAGD